LCASDANYDANDYFDFATKVSKSDGGKDARLLLARARGPIHRNHAANAKDHPDFGFDVRQKFGNPRWRVSLPVDQGWMPGYKISKNPESRSERRDDPADD